MIAPGAFASPQLALHPVPPPWPLTASVAPLMSLKSARANTAYAGVEQIDNTPKMPAPKTNHVTIFMYNLRLEARSAHCCQFVILFVPVSSCVQLGDG